MTTLALEFSSSERSVAVIAKTSGCESVVSETVETLPSNTTKPVAMIEQALQQAGLEREQIECIAIGLGPGSYTGIRVAIAFAQGWQLARGVKLLGVSSTECLAAQARFDGLRGRCAVVIDAQREEFYFAEYEITPEAMREVSPLRLATMDEVRSFANAGGKILGPDLSRWFPDAVDLKPRAAALGQLAVQRNHFVAGEQLQPIYLREAKFVKAPPPRMLPG